MGARVAAPRAAPTGGLRAVAGARLRRFRSFGVTTVEVKTGYGLDAPHEARLLDVAAGLDSAVPTLLAAHVVPAEFVDRPDEYVDVARSQIVPPGRGRGRVCDAWGGPDCGFTA